MKRYEVDVHFYKAYSVKAKNAEEASGELQKMIDSDNFAISPDDIEYNLPDEDDPVTCPLCEGDGVDPNGTSEDPYDDPCPKCDGEGEIYLEEYFD